MVLATDCNQTIAVFIYDDIQWGDGAQIGFYAGDGHTNYTLQEALTNQTLTMHERSNIGQQGVFVFRTDSKYCIYYVFVNYASIILSIIGN